jgi:uncharacterized protein YjbI with pentapeptide repeats
LRPLTAVNTTRFLHERDADGMSFDTALRKLVEKLEQDLSLTEPQHLRQRINALDQLDAYLPETQSIAGAALHRRANAIYAHLESANSRLYDAIRVDIQRGAGRSSLRNCMIDSNGGAQFANRTGYDYLDELLSGVLHLQEPSAQVVRLESEMVAYQPTPARHIFDLIARTGLAERDVLIDLGSGLGNVTLLASICSGANCTGIELEPSYVECARNSARSLNLSNATFIQGDVRDADFSAGTIFYLYTPFTGAILRDVLDLLRQQALRREIRICTFGPCTPIIAEEQWLSVIGPLQTDRVAVFRSRE